VRWAPDAGLASPGGANPSSTAAGAVEVELNGVARRYAVAHEGDTLWIGRDGFQAELRRATSARAGAAAGLDALEAPMPGTVLLIHAANGERVDEGDVLMVLESMKMELPIVAPHDGVVADLELAIGDRVGQRQRLASVHA
jgi:acetyl-CoA/propionyl-CoA carboxylase biotin carboxyl carrier protein